MFFSKPKLSIHEAHRILSDVAQEKCFNTSNGMVLRNLHELAQAISHMEENVFLHHVTKEKNDFATWVQEVVEDSYLASKLIKTRKQPKSASLIRDRITSIEKHIDLEKEKIQEATQDIYFHKEKIQKISLSVLCILLFFIGIFLGYRLIQ